MFDLAVVEIAGRQYTLTPELILSVNSLGDIKTLVCDKVILLAKGDKVQIGTPYLKDTLTFDIVEQTRGRKVRVAKFHAKANYRKVRGSRDMMTVIKLKEDK